MAISDLSLTDSPIAPGTDLFNNWVKWSGCSLKDARSLFGIGNIISSKNASIALATSKTNIVHWSRVGREHISKRKGRHYLNVEYLDPRFEVIDGVPIKLPRHKGRFHIIIDEKFVEILVSRMSKPYRSYYEL